MNREHILSVLYDMTLTIGGEGRLNVLLTKVLQRFLYHTSFPVGLVLERRIDAQGKVSMVLASVVGDHTLALRQGKALDLPYAMLEGEAELRSDTALLATLPSGRTYYHCLKLPIDADRTILLLSMSEPESSLPLTQVFKPVLRNLAKAIELCQRSEQLTQTLIADRDQARSDLNVALLVSERERAFLRKLTDTIPDLIWIKDPNGVYLACNPTFERFFGVKESSIVGKTDYDFVDKELADFFRANDMLAVKAASPKINEEWLTFASDGYRGLFETTKVPMLDGDGHLIGVLGVAHNITARKHAEEQLHLAASVFTYAREGIMITATDGSIIDVNETFCSITGYSREEAIGQTPKLLSSGRQSASFYAKMWRTLAKDGHWSGEIWNRRKSGEVFVEMLTISAVRDAQGRTEHYVALFSDISKIKEHERQLEHIAHFDSLTALPNRVLLADRLNQAMVQVRRRDLLLAVAYLDLDGFKTINDLYGHQMGDRFLAALASRMKLALREGDTLARLGGDEFVAVLLDLPDVPASEVLLQRLLNAAAETVQIDGLTLQVSGSVGVAFYPQIDDVDADQVLRQADQAMYQAKLAGKNCFHHFDPDQDRNVRGQNESLSHIRQALDARQFVLYFQPKVNMRSGALVGAEALIRWLHPERGLLPPAMFLPVIEDHPLAIELGEWVIDHALTHLEEWQAQGLDIPVSVNIGALQLQQADFVERLCDILAKHPGVKPSRLELEVLETSALRDIAQVSQVLHACMELGIMCALDDFGTGYSSLSYLKRLPAQILKIDQSFVRNMLDDPDDLAILDGVLGLSTAFRRQPIAEGVETVEHGIMLLQLGCDFAQGYGVARPMPADDIVAWSQRWKPDPRWSDVPALSRDELPLLYAGVEHRAWIVGLEAYFKGARKSPPPLDHQACRFGVWLNTERLGSRGRQAEFVSLEAHHRQVHKLAAELVALHTAYKTEDVMKRLPELHQLRADLLVALLKIKPRTGYRLLRSSGASDV
jgi:diguanylate cyclase (GGDEF)-like protein/PAS domain S-box-containing protein